MSVRFRGNLLLRQRNHNVLECPGSGEKGFFLLDRPALLCGANLELGGGEDRADFWTCSWVGGLGAEPMPPNSTS